MCALRDKLNACCVKFKCDDLKSRSIDETSFHEYSLKFVKLVFKLDFTNIIFQKNKFQKFLLID